MSKWYVLTWMDESGEYIDDGLQDWQDDPEVDISLCSVGHVESTKVPTATEVGLECGAGLFALVNEDHLVPFKVSGKMAYKKVKA